MNLQKQKGLTPDREKLTYLQLSEHLRCVQEPLLFPVLTSTL